MIPLFASKMENSAQQLIGVAEYKVESPMAKTSTSGKKENPFVQGSVSDKFYF
jgi:hypothetical protein